MLFPEGMAANCLAPSQVLSLCAISAKLRSEVGPESRSGITGRDPQAHFLPVMLNLGGAFWGLELWERPQGTFPSCSAGGAFLWFGTL